MDQKEKDLLSHYYRRIAASLFDEKDILPFLILLRPYARPSTPVREFADFVAHRVRERGEFHSFLDDTRVQASLATIAPRASPREVQESIRQAQPVFRSEEISASFAEVLGSLGFPPLDDGRIGDVTLCIISLLQDVRFVDDGHDLCTLLLAFDAEQVVLFGKIPELRPGEGGLLVLLATPNRYVRFAPPDDQAIMAMPNEFVTIVNVNGELKLISMEAQQRT